MGEYLKRNGRFLFAAVVIVLFCAALPELFAAGKAIETGRSETPAGRRLRATTRST